MVRRPSGRTALVRLAPVQRLVVEAALDGRLDDGEKRRNIEIARREQRIVADMENLAGAVARADARVRVAGLALITTSSWSPAMMPMAVVDHSRRRSASNARMASSPGARR